MSNFSFSIFKTKIDGREQVFRLEDPVERRKYFDAKAGKEIEYLREYLRKNTFVGFFLGPKNSGKGTYTKLFMEAVGGDHIAHISVGDIVRNVDKDVQTEKGRHDLIKFLERRYRGFIDIDQIMDALRGRNTTTLLPTEGILALVEREIDRIGRKAIFIDGFPRNLDQVSYSLYFRALIGYRDDQDFFVFIDVPESVIDERMKYRVTCPVCQSPRNTKLLRTKEIGYDAAAREFYLLCDNPNCSGFCSARMTAKEGDALGIEPIRARVEMDAKVMQKLLDLRGVPKVFLRNTIPVDQAHAYVDDYEITPSYHYAWDEHAKAVRVTEKSWVVTDGEGVPAYSLLPAAVALALVKQTATVLGLTPLEVDRDHGVK